MLRFLQKIRQNLFVANPPSVGEGLPQEKPAWPVGKYLLYAIGEIVLVVIGILIALSINNWNDTPIIEI